MLYHGEDLYAPNVDAVEVRKRIGMVFQKPNPFPKSIYDNIAFGPRVLGRKEHLEETVERALIQAALWDEVKDRLKTNAFGMSGGQQQRLCIARCLAVNPDVILMDEPCSALDPISTGKIEDLMLELKKDYSIVIVTHNMQQAARVSDKTAFFTVELDEDEDHRTGQRGRVRRHREDLHQPVRLANRGVRDREGRARDTMGDTTRSHFQDELAELERQALGGLDMVATALDRALETVQHQDVELASMVIADDDRIDGRYLEVHQGILSLLALQAPVAGDLRLVAALLHVIKHVERMGDQCVNMAKLVPLAGHEPPADEEMLATHPAHGRAGAPAGGAVRHRRSRAATWASPRTSSARTTRSIPSTARSSRMALALGDDADRREWAMHMMLVARCIERIGDNAVDIGEQTAFVVTGLFREFEDASHPELAPHQPA